MSSQQGVKIEIKLTKNFFQILFLEIYLRAKIPVSNLFIFPYSKIAKLWIFFQNGRFFGQCFEILAFLKLSTFVFCGKLHF